MRCRHAILVLNDSESLDEGFAIVSDDFRDSSIATNKVLEDPSSKSFATLPLERKCFEKVRN